MSITINYKKSLKKNNTSNIVLFVDEKFNISSLNKFLPRSDYYFLSDLLKTKDLKKNILSFDVNSKKK